jgi:hypothetical protein
MNDTNGMQSQQHPDMTQLPPAREAVIDQAHRMHQEVSHERDLLRREVADLRTDIAALKKREEILDELFNTMESKLETMQLARDQAISDRAVYETLFVAANALFRAFQIPSAPLVRDREQASEAHLREQEATINEQIRQAQESDYDQARRYDAAQYEGRRSGGVDDMAGSPHRYNRGPGG